MFSIGGAGSTCSITGAGATFSLAGTAGKISSTGVFSIGSSIRSERRPEGSSGHFPQTAPGPEGWAQPIVPDEQTNKRNVLPDSLNDLHLWNFLQYHLNASCRKLRIHQTTGITIDLRNRCNRNVFDHRCRCCTGVFRSERDVLSQWRRCCIGVIRHVFDLRRKRCLADGKSRCHVLDHWRALCAGFGECRCRVFGHWNRRSGRGIGRGSRSNIFVNRSWRLVSVYAD